MQNNKIDLLSNSILLLPDKRLRKNYFQSDIFKNFERKEINKNCEQKDKLIKDLEDILICCICYEYLDNPVNDPTCCPHYACKSCFDQYFQKKNSNSVPCPLCRKLIKKKNLVKIPIVESLKGILKDIQNTRIDDNNIKIEENCKHHPNNKIKYICLDCQINMCPICEEEKKKHENHQLVNYERYVDLFNFIQNNFEGIKQHIKEREVFIREYTDFYILLDQQKNSYLEFLNDMSLKIHKIYKKQQETINKMIGESMETIAKLRNFMLNIKYHISSQFKQPYDNIENLEEIKEEINKRVNKLKIKEIHEIANIDIKNKSLKNLNLILPKQFSVTFNIKEFLDNTHVACFIDKDKNYEFGLELSEDKKLINVYLDIKRIIGNQSNDSSYVVFVEYGLNKKKLYLKSTELNNEYYSYERSLLIEELINNKEKNVEMKINFLYISLK